MMTEEHIQKGNLVYIPSGVCLIERSSMTLEGDPPVVESFTYVKKPTNCVIMSNTVENNLCKVLYCGKLWYVKVSDTYEIREQKGVKEC